MGGGDLNLKKSWHPQTLRNVERVWKAEQKAEAESKKIEQLRRELLEEKAREEMQRHAVQQGISKKKSERLDWMYSAPGQINREEYLLGKPIDKQVDPLAKEDEGLGSLPGASFTGDSSANNASDLAAKVRDDPLFMIKKKEDEKKKELLQNPVKMKQLKEMLEAHVGKSKKKKGKKDKKKKKEKRGGPSRHNNASEDSFDSGEEEKRNKNSARKMSPINGHKSSRKSRHKSDKKERASRKRRHSRSESPPVRHPSGSQSGDRQRERRLHKHSSPSISPSPPRRQKYSNGQSDRKGKHRHRDSSSPSPPHRSRSPFRNGNKRKGFPTHRNKQRSRSVSPVQSGQASQVMKRRVPSPRADRRQRGSAMTKKMDPEELERRRQEMLSNAQWRNEQRVENVTKYKEEAKKEAEAEGKNSKKSADFLSSMKVQSFSSQSTASVSDRIKRNINSVQRTAHALDTFLKK
ncbi:predicted protein [Nematostella vectensis]|uniref:CBF1-interacting co-repressor CIR N-terminal domain-containing protein n=1 Tax=Nematostella vectensis TaxID=45351 RepID=A7RRX2_NEMVE|nr:predicted protein [Nematostella vectensis]|eukprot:XP_001637963.1 predicted protein [Nematostella vectensis]